jgi:hypothetical protein
MKARVKSRPRRSPSHVANALLRKAGVSAEQLFRAESDRSRLYSVERWVTDYRNHCCGSCDLAFPICAIALREFVDDHIADEGRLIADGVADLLAIDEARRTADSASCADHETCTESEVSGILDELIERFLAGLAIGLCFYAPVSKRLTLAEFRSLIKGTIEVLQDGSKACASRPATRARPTTYSM